MALFDVQHEKFLFSVVESCTNNKLERHGQLRLNKYMNFVDHETRNIEIWSRNNS